MATNPHFPDLSHQNDDRDVFGLAPLGHNRPPPDEQARIDFDEALRAAKPDFLLKLDELSGAAQRAHVSSDEELALAGDLDAALRDAAKLVDGVHRQVKAPYLDAGRAVDGKKNVLADQIESARALVRQRSNIYLNEREARRQAEAASAAAAQRRHAAEAEAARQLRDEAIAADDVEALEIAPVIAAPVYVPSVSGAIKTDTGVIISGRTVARSEVTDYAAAFSAVQSNPKVREAIDKAVAALVKAGMREIAGVRVWDEQQMQTRG